jgi:hypothetical protein
LLLPLALEEDDDDEEEGKDLELLLTLDTVCDVDEFSICLDLETSLLTRAALIGSGSDSHASNTAGGSDSFLSDETRSLSLSQNGKGVRNNRNFAT